MIEYSKVNVKSNLFDYSNACILVIGNTDVTGADANTKVAFKNCAPFRKFRTNK